MAVVFSNNFMPCDPVRLSVAGRAVKAPGRALPSALQTHGLWGRGYHAAGVVCGFTDRCRSACSGGTGVF